VSHQKKKSHLYKGKRKTKKLGKGTNVKKHTQNFAHLELYIYTWGDPKIPGIVKKKYLNYLYKFETLVPFEVLPLRLDASNPSTVPNAGNIV